MEFPQYITINGYCAVRLMEISKTGKTARYWRDAGRWDVWVSMMEDDSMICKNNKGHMKHSNGVVAQACSPEFWSKDNAGYL